MSRTQYHADHAYRENDVDHSVPAHAWIDFSAPAIDSADQIADSPKTRRHQMLGGRGTALSVVTVDHDVGVARQIWNAGQERSQRDQTRGGKASHLPFIWLPNIYQEHLVFRRQ